MKNDANVRALQVVCKSPGYEFLCFNRIFISRGRIVMSGLQHGILWAGQRRLIPNIFCIFAVSIEYKREKGFTA